MTETPSEPPVNDNVVPISHRPSKSHQPAQEEDDSDAEEGWCEACGEFHFNFDLTQIVNAVKHQTKRAISSGLPMMQVNVDDMAEILAHLDFLHDEVHGDGDAKS